MHINIPLALVLLPGCIAHTEKNVRVHSALFIDHLSPSELACAGPGTVRLSMVTPAGRLRSFSDATVCRDGEVLVVTQPAGAEVRVPIDDVGDVMLERATLERDETTRAWKDAGPAIAGGLLAGFVVLLLAGGAASAWADGWEQPWWEGGQ